MRIERSVVEHVARLARLELNEEELRLFTGQLGRILDYCERLDREPIEGVLPTAHVLPLENVDRPDQVAASLPHEEVMEQAPDRAEGYFRVPRVFEEGAV